MDDLLVSSGDQSGNRHRDSPYAMAQYAMKSAI
jgi:hypothetical protein